MKHIMNLIRNSAIYIAIVNVVEIYRAATHRHDWVYSSQVEELGIHIGTKQPIKQIFKTRYCTKCGTKEKKHTNGTWYQCKLSKEEQRDKKLRDLGIL
jgi:NADH pyrophosphatase NudC (nudix superfamily)